MKRSNQVVPPKMRRRRAVPPTDGRGQERAGTATTRPGRGTSPQGANVTQEQFRDLSDNLVSVGGRMRALINAMTEELSYPEYGDSDVPDLNSIMSDLVTEVEALGDRTDRLAYSKPDQAGPVPSQEKP